MTAATLVRLGDVCEQDRRVVKPGDAANLPYIGLESIEANTGRFHVGALSKTPDAPQANSFEFGSHHVLYGKLRPYLNKVAVPEFEGKCSTEIIPLRPSEDLDRRYLAYFLRSPATVAQISARTAGARMPRADMDFVLGMQMPLPPLAEQRRIVDILSRAEGILRLRREAEKKASELVPAIFLEMFGDPATNPKGWPTRRLGEFARIAGGSSLPSGEPFTGQGSGLQLVKVSDMNLPGNETEIVATQEWTSLSGATSSRVGANAVIFPKRGAAIATNKKRITTRPALLDPNLMGVEVDSSVADSAYLLQWFAAFDLSSISSGTTVPQLNKKDLAPLQVVLPPISLQRMFATRRNDALAIRKHQGRAHVAAQLTFASLLSRVFLKGNLLEAAPSQRY